MEKLQNDAMTCYDRIVSNFTSLVYRYHHVPANACKIQATALKEIKFKVTTALNLTVSS